MIQKVRVQLVASHQCDRWAHKNYWNNNDISNRLNPKHKCNWRTIKLWFEWTELFSNISECSSLLYINNVASYRPYCPPRPHLLYQNSRTTITETVSNKTLSLLANLTRLVQKPNLLHKVFSWPFPRFVCITVAVHTQICLLLYKLYKDWKKSIIFMILRVRRAALITWKQQHLINGHF